MQPARRKIDGHDTATDAILHDEIHGKIFDVKLGVVFKRLLIERMQHGVPGPVGSRASPLRRSFPVMRGHATERSLINSTIFSPRERHAVMLEFGYGIGGFLAHVFDRVLITEPV